MWKSNIEEFKLLYFGNTFAEAWYIFISIFRSRMELTFYQLNDLASLVTRQPDSPNL